MIKFHRRCGDRVTLLNHNLTATRNFVEFNQGLIFGAEPLIDDVMFEVKIDRKVNVWNGSLEIGVTTLDPEFLELPATATKLRNTAWILSGNSIVKDCITLVNDYGPELDSLREGDCVGVTRTSKGELIFFINGRCLGVAAKDVPQRVFAVIDLYGQCVQVSIIQNNYSAPMRPAADAMTEIVQYVGSEEERGQGEAAAWADPKTARDAHIQMPIACPRVSQDHIRFHSRCGILVKLSSNNKSAERARPLDDYNNGVVMTHRPLYDNELFEIRIDRLVDKWSGSIEVGVTTHSPATIRFPSTMTNMDSGTIMMSGCKVLLNGHGSCMEYGNFNLDELREGDTVGMMRKSNGKLHYFINGIDQGVATDKVATQVWGVIDLYGMTVKVTIVDPCEEIDSNIHHLPIRILRAPQLPIAATNRPAVDEESLLFHTLRDSNVIIINNGKTAHRPNAFEHFNNGVVTTNRTLKTNELFQVRLDLIVPKWAGSIEIGVTQHSSKDLKIPYRMSNEKSGTWGITGEDVIRDGVIIIPQYVRNLNKLVEGDAVGVMRKDLGILHFFVNGVDQGPAAFNIPEHVFGIIDLYGRVAQATIVDIYVPPPSVSPGSPISSESNATVYPEMCFHRIHGRNARLSRNRLTASRATVYSEFNDAVLFSSRPLRECDMFEIRIEKMVDCWIGSLEIGVTAIRPDDLEAGGGVDAVAGTATDLSWDTYILSGAAMMKDGECVRSGYPLDLDTLTVGSRVGLMWHADRSLHYYLDGMDMGKAWHVPHLNIYAVVDLYGQCAQVTIVQTGDRNYNYNGCTADQVHRRRGYVTPPPPYWTFSEYCGQNIVLRNGYNIAHRMFPDPSGAIVFSSHHLLVDEIYEIQVHECKYIYAGSFRMGVTDVNILNANVNRHLPLTISWLPHFTAYIDGRYIKYSKPGTRKQEFRSFVPSFEWLRPGDRVGFKKTANSRVLIYYNSELLDTAFEKVPDKVYVVCELGGQVTKIKSVARGTAAVQANQVTIKNDNGTMEPQPANANAMDNATGQSADAADADAADGAPASVPAPNVDPDPYDTLGLEYLFGVGYNTELHAILGFSTNNDEYLPSAPSVIDTPPTSPEPYTDEPEPCNEKYAMLYAEEKESEERDVDETEASNVYEDEAPEMNEPMYINMNERVPSNEDEPVATDVEKHITTNVDEQVATNVDEAVAINEDEPVATNVDEAAAGQGIEAVNSSSIEPMAGPSHEPAAGPLNEQPEVVVARRQYRPLPFTFHYLHGENVRLRSSDTVATRVRGYAEGIAIASHPLRRGHQCRFRVDKITQKWEGTICIGAVSALPVEYILPRSALNIEIPAWIITNDLILKEGQYIITDRGQNLDLVTVNTVLTLHFRYNGELLLEMEGVPYIVIGVIPRMFVSIYPTIDLYGKVVQVSILLHPLVVVGGNSLDLPSIEENQPDDYDDPPNDDDYGGDDDEDEDDNDEAKTNSGYGRRGPRLSEWQPMSAWHNMNLAKNLQNVQDEPSASSAPGPSRRPDCLPGLPNANDARNFQIKCKIIYSDRPLHHSLILPHGNETIEINQSDNDEAAKQISALRRTLSTEQFSRVPVGSDPDEEDDDSRNSLVNALSLGSRIGDDDDTLNVPEICDTNIRHNDRYPEASDVDLLDNEIVDALTLDAGNLPDLTEEQSPSFDESTRRDELWSDGVMHIETLRYLNNIIRYSPDENTARFADRDWVFFSETNGNCENMHLALKFWNYLVLPYPDMREVVASGQVRCFCNNCQPEAVPPFAGWVRIERGVVSGARVVPEVARGEHAFWHVMRSTLVSAATLVGDQGSVRRPAVLAEAPATNPSAADIWFDEEGKPHHTVFALDIDYAPATEPKTDRLLAYMIYLRSHMTYNEENIDPLSFED